jgi:hypothetical protein
MEKSNQNNSKKDSFEEPSVIEAIKKSFENDKLHRTKKESYLTRFKKLLATKIGETFK